MKKLYIVLQIETYDYDRLPFVDSKGVYLEEDKAKKKMQLLKDQAWLDNNNNLYYDIHVYELKGSNE
tara:strand:- start:187 stop:387 length:201 start_codon:yes stop_codon:yes gene_type:complete